MFMVFDLTLKKTLENLNNWLKEAIEFGFKDLPLYLVGNKVF